MPSPSFPTSALPDPPGRFCREVERAFVARRGGAAVASPADWQLILDWERRGVPLPVVLEGLECAFERRLAPAPRLALRSCAAAVEAAFAGYLRRRAGLPVPEGSGKSESPAAPAPAPPAANTRPRPEAASPHPGPNAADPVAAVAPAADRLPALAPAASERRRGCAVLAADLGRWRPPPAALDPETAAAAVAAARARLTGLAAGGPWRRDADPTASEAAAEAGLEETLEEIETELLRRLAEALREPLRSEVASAAARPLAAYRRRMPPGTYREALAAAVRRRLPRVLDLPALGLDPALPGRPPPGRRLPESPPPPAGAPPGRTARRRAAPGRAAPARTTPGRAASGRPEPDLPGAKPPGPEPAERKLPAADTPEPAASPSAPRPSSPLSH